MKGIFWTAIICPVVVFSTYSKKYDIDGSKLKKGNTIFNDLVERKGDSVIRYTYPLFANDKTSVRIWINGKRYTKRDREVYPKFAKRYEYLLEEIDAKEIANRHEGVK